VFGYRLILIGVRVEFHHFNAPAVCPLPTAVCVFGCAVGMMGKTETGMIGKSGRGQGITCVQLE
jgi:hypothetical protein